MRPRTRLLEAASPHRDDPRLLHILAELPVSPFIRERVVRAALLNESGEPYREVHLDGEYASLVFAAKMNASGFRQVQAGDAPAEGYEIVFAKHAAAGLDSPGS